MSHRVRRLGAGDEEILASLAREDADFDIEGRGGDDAPLEPARAARYLANPAVLFWIAFEEERATGFLACVVVPLRSGAGEEVLLYEIGVRASHRRQGVGAALVGELRRWMREASVGVAWVLADNPGAVAFYRAIGFTREPHQPTYMTLELDDSPRGD